MMSRSAALKKLNLSLDLTNFDAYGSKGGEIDPPATLKAWQLPEDLEIVAPKRAVKTARKARDRVCRLRAAFACTRRASTRDDVSLTRVERQPAAIVLR